jgi:hypothetical protein
VLRLSGHRGVGGGEEVLCGGGWCTAMTGSDRGWRRVVGHGGKETV